MPDQVQEKRREIENLLEFFVLSKEREIRERPSHHQQTKNLNLNFSENLVVHQTKATPKNGRFNASESEPQTPVLYSMEQLPTLDEEAGPKMADQLALNISKMNDANQKTNLRVIQQLEHKLDKQKEVNRDLRVEKDMYMLKLEETSKRVGELAMA